MIADEVILQEYVGSCYIYCSKVIYKKTFINIYFYRQGVKWKKILIVY